MKLKNVNELSRIKRSLAHYFFEEFKTAFIVSRYHLLNAYVSDYVLRPSLYFLTQSSQVTIKQVALLYSISLKKVRLKG